MEKPYIGIMVSPLLFNKIKKGKDLPILSFYEEAGVLNDITPCYFCLEDLQVGRDWIFALVKNPSEKGYTSCPIQRPNIIHNRGYHSSKTDKEKIHNLQKEGIHFYNDWNSLGKLQVDRILRENPAITPYLPATMKFNQKNMERMMYWHQELIIKPIKGSLGKRNMKATRMNSSEFLLVFPSGHGWAEEVFTINDWPKKLIDKMSESKFLIQERIALAEYNGSPFDIRVSVQKNGAGAWQITGMVAKVAQSGNFVTNVARGGTCFPISEIIKELPHLRFGQVLLAIEHLSLLCAKQLEYHLPHLADIGLDIGMTNDGFPMFIECNARDLRYSFEKANLMAEWKSTYITPISYGKYLLESQEKQLMRMRDD